MKKSRPAIMLSVLCQPSAVEIVQGIIFAETSTFGIRYQKMNRKTLDRELAGISFKRRVEEQSFNFWGFSG